MKIVKIIAIITVAVFGLSLTAPVFADNICNNDNVSEEVKAAAGCKGTGVGKLDDTIVNILNTIIAALGVVAVVFVVIGGINYMTSSGDTAKLEKAKKTILYALIGLAVSVLAFAIVNWTITAIKNSTKTTSHQFFTSKSIAYFPHKL